MSFLTQNQALGREFHMLNSCLKGSVTNKHHQSKLFFFWHWTNRGIFFLLTGARQYDECDNNRAVTKQINEKCIPSLLVGLQEAGGFKRKICRYIFTISRKTFPCNNKR